MDRYNDTVVEPEFLNFVGVQRHGSLRPTEDGQASVQLSISRYINPRRIKRARERVVGQCAHKGGIDEAGVGVSEQRGTPPSSRTIPSSTGHPPSDPALNTHQPRAGWYGCTRTNGRNDCRVYWVTIATWLALRIGQKNASFDNKTRSFRSPHPSTE